MNESHAESRAESPKGIPSASSTGSSATDIERPIPEPEKAGEMVRNIHGMKWVLTVCAILSCVFLFALDTTVVADIQPNIIRSLGEFEKYTWLATAYAIPGLTLVLVQSKLYGLFNIKWLYFGYVVLFEIGSAISGAAPTMNSLIIGRLIAGIGGTGMYVGSLTFFSVITTPKERPIYTSLITPTWGIGTVLGPIVGGALAESKVGWRWGFYINLFIFAAAAPIMLFILPSLNFAPKTSTKQKLATVDWLGLIAWTGLCVSFFMAITFGGTLYEWDSHSETILWVFVGVTAVSLVLTHKFHPFVLAEDRFYPAHMLRNWKLGILQLTVFAAPAAVYIPIYYLPLFFQFARGESPVEAAVRLLPFVFMVATVSILNGVFMSKLGYYMPWFLAGGLLAVVGGALMYTIDTTTTNSAIYGYSVVLGLGGGCFLMTAFGCVSAVTDNSDMFNAIGVLSLAQCIGIIFFPAISGGIFQNLGAKFIRPHLPPDFSGNARAILAGSSSPEFQGFSPDLQAEISRAIISAMNNLYIMTIISGGLTAILSPFLGFDKVGA
ncbi:major facilitator superfamily domain-containing protein [Massariosphaeria phaeospora]|uniref:Major facilitator superfamily domain-containing protein n=1 Tax=Massariosphaeria phaeospora TaxID=100035 RepID=A0A7C8ING9_9PLEO|nr:major facilitator superfamily domain-containing protein [Massariosphaeria phaeospora]